MRRTSLLLAITAAVGLAGSAQADLGLPVVTPPVVQLPAAFPATDASVQRYLAPLSECSGQDAIGAAPAVQVHAMRCLVNWARARAGERLLGDVGRLDRSARMRAAEIVRCGQFSHTPCGDSFLHVFVASGYLSGSGTVGENLAWGQAGVGSARVAMAEWLASPPHRANLFTRWRDLGVALAKQNALFGAAQVSIWVAQFGRRGR